MSKFAKLSDEVMKKKLRGTICSDFSEELVIEINSLLENFDRVKIEEMCLRVEVVQKEIKDRKKIEEAEKKKADEEARLAAEEEAKNNAPVIEKKEYKSLFKSVYSETITFKDYKNSFGVQILDENEKPIYPSLREQFESVASKYSKLQMYRAKYPEEVEYDETKEFMINNLNSGLVRSCEEIIDHVFICFRIIRDPTTNKCRYVSNWIVCTEEPLSEILTDIGIQDSFILEKVDSYDEIERLKFLGEMQRSTDQYILKEVYLK